MDQGHVQASRREVSKGHLLRPHWTWGWAGLRRLALLAGVWGRPVCRAAARLAGPWGARVSFCGSCEGVVQRSSQAFILPPLRRFAQGVAPPLGVSLGLQLAHGDSLSKFSQRAASRHGFHGKLAV